jgi:hypothetical protein
MVIKKGYFKMNERYVYPILILLLIAIFNCGVGNKQTGIEASNNISSQKSEEKVENIDKNIEKAQSAAEEFSFEGKWCSITLDGEITDHFLLEIKKISEKEYRVKFTNKYFGKKGEVENFNTIGFLENNNLMIIKTENIAHSIDVGKDINYGKIIGLFWDADIPETEVAVFTRCD